MSAVEQIVCSCDSRFLLTISSDRTIKTWDFKTGKCLFTAPLTHWFKTSASFSPDSGLLAFIDGVQTIKILDVNESRSLRSLRFDADEAHSVVFSHDSKRVAAAGNSTCIIWDAITGKHLKTLDRSADDRIDSTIAFSHNSTRLMWVSCVGWNNCHDLVTIWDPNDGEYLRALECYALNVASPSSSADSQFALGVVDGEVIKVWNVNSGKCLTSIKAGELGFASAVFSPDAKSIASASFDKTLRIWSRVDGTCKQTLDIGAVASGLSFDCTGDYLHTALGTIEIRMRTTLQSSGMIATEPKYIGWGLSSDTKWVTFNSENWLWLPSDYRPISSVVSGHSIAVGDASGRVLVLKFDGVNTSL